MEKEATAFLAALTGPQREVARRPFTDAARQWIEYRPRPRPGVSLADLSPAARKAAHRLLATGLAPGAYAQAMAVMALEEVLDRREGWQRGRHSADYQVIVFGQPGGDRWAWRFEGHHLSVTMTVVDGVVAPAPLFLGANPARVDVAGRPVLRPLGVEEDLGRELLLSLTSTQRDRAVVSGHAPGDVRSGPNATFAPVGPPGIAARDLGYGSRALLEQLVTVHLGRLPDALARALHDAGSRDQGLHFAWEGPPGPHTRHYYRIEGPGLLVEFDQTQDDGNHAHSVLRRPRGDFGADLLAAHHAAG
jgi:hypothetical protein